MYWHCQFWITFSFSNGFNNINSVRMQSVLVSWRPLSNSRGIWGVSWSSLSVCQSMGTPTVCQTAVRSRCGLHAFIYSLNIHPSDCKKAYMNWRKWKLFQGFQQCCQTGSLRSLVWAHWVSAEDTYKRGLWAPPSGNNFICYKRYFSAIFPLNWFQTYMKSQNQNL